MRVVLLILSFCLISKLSYSQVTLSELRTSLEKVKNDEDYAFNLYERLESRSDYTNVINGYYGIIEATLAEHSYNPLKKLSYFNGGKDRLEKAIANDNLNVELRYLRLIIQLNVPSLLGYSDKIEIDKNQIILNIENQKESLGQSFGHIIEFLLELEISSESQKKKLKLMLNG